MAGSRGLAILGHMSFRRGSLQPCKNTQTISEQAERKQVQAAGGHPLPPVTVVTAEHSKLKAPEGQATLGLKTH